MSKIFNQLDIHDRMTIQSCLHNNFSKADIASRLNVSRSTITRELSNNGVFKPGDSLCPSLSKLIVCNTCVKKNICTRSRFYYDFEHAQNLSDNRRRNSRSCPKISPSSISTINTIVSSGVNLGQSLHHIYVSNPILKTLCSESTIRRLVYRGALDVKAHQLRRFVTFKHFYSNKDKVQSKDIKMLLGRNFKDYIRYRLSHKSLNFVQYDSVIGKINDKKAILTITFPKFNFQFGYVIDKGSANSVNYKIRRLFMLLGNDLVRKIFPINLADNGTEFSKFYNLELDTKGEQICKTFFTNPYKATDKPECERNHQFIRYFIPKGKSLNNITQEELNIMFSNINSYVRKSKGDKTPYDLVKKAFGVEFLNAIDIKRINKKRVRLTK